MTETWKPCAGFEDTHEVSDLGRIRSIPRTIVGSDGRVIHFKGRVLSPCQNRDGYLATNLKRKGVLVHVLVLETFVGPRPDGLQACHNDGNPANARLDNLRWDTPKNNVQVRRKHGTYQFGARNPSYRVPWETILEIRASPESCDTIARRLGLDSSYCWQVRAGQLRAQG